MRLGKYNQSKTIKFSLVAPDGIDLIINATFAAGDIKISKDEGAEANTTNLPTDEGTGYSLVLTATEMSAARISLYIIDQTGTKVWLDISIEIETYGHASAEHAFDLDTAAETMRGTDNAALASVCTEARLAELAAANLPANIDTLLTRIIGTLAAGTHNPATAAQIAVLSDWINGGRLDLILDIIAADTTTDLPALINSLNNISTAEVNAEVDTALVDFFTSVAALIDAFYDEPLAGHNIGGTGGKAMKQLQEGTISAESTVNDAGATTTSFITNLIEAVDNHFIDVSLVFIDGALKGQSRPVLSYNGTTKAITLEEALTSAPANGSSFIIKTDHVHPVTQIQAGLATEAKQDIIAAYLDTEIAAILTDTGTTLPALLAIIDTVVDAIKTKTDSLNFTKANELDSNVQSVNGVTITGDGSAAPFDV